MLAHEARLQARRESLQARRETLLGDHHPAAAARLLLGLRTVQLRIHQPGQPRP